MGVITAPVEGSGWIPAWITFVPNFMGNLFSSQQNRLMVKPTLCGVALFYWCRDKEKGQPDKIRSPFSMVYTLISIPKECDY
jgi:hypothetical protein